jgi:hypothetical protein
MGCGVVFMRRGAFVINLSLAVIKTDHSNKELARFTHIIMAFFITKEQVSLQYHVRLINSIITPNNSFV